MQNGAWRRFDIPLLLITLALIIIGEVMIYSAYEASLPLGDRPLKENTVFRQGLFAAGGLVAYLIAAAMDYRALVSLWRWLYLVALAVLGITQSVGFISFGAQSWLDLRAFGVQPSELCKVLMILVLAHWLGREQRDLESSAPLFVSLLLILPPVGLIYMQPDFGTALILFAIWIGMVYLAGVRLRHLFVLACAGGVTAPVVWFQMKPYMRDRIVTFFLPGDDPSGASYNVTQALISIGSGGFWGKGLLHGTQSQLYFLRVRHTDFIFSVLAEELGFLGSFLLIALFAALVSRLLSIASQAPDRQGQLLASGVATMILVQALINMGMNANLLPVTGLPLPLVSYGGSSLVTTLLALGLVQSVAMRRKSAESSLL